MALTFTKQRLSQTLFRIRSNIKMADMTRFMIISDTHNLEFKEGTIFPFRLPAPKVDVILHCGDITQIGGASYYKKALKMLGALNAELKLIIAGNHDVDLDKEYCPSYKNREHSQEQRKEEHEEAMEVMTGPLAKESGVTYLSEGTHTFTLKSGATFTVYASPYTPEFSRWGFPYEHHEDRFNTSEQIPKDQLSPKGKLVKSIAENPIPSFPDVHIVMTHGPPRFIMDECRSGRAGCENLFRAVSRARPLLHCFGHIHEGHGATMVTWKAQLGKKLLDHVFSGGSSEVGTFKVEVGEEIKQMDCYPDEATPGPLAHGKKTLFVNAAIRDGGYNPSNPAWLVDLKLPKA
jgi:Icc-related predicted phosphoesterase